jgi:hypothetical protein
MMVVTKLIMIAEKKEYSHLVIFLPLVLRSPLVSVYKLTRILRIQLIKKKHDRLESTVCLKKL